MRIVGVWVGKFSRKKKNDMAVGICTTTGLVYGCLDAMPEHAFDTARSRVQRLVLAVGRVLCFRNSEAQPRTTESHNF